MQKPQAKIQNVRYNTTRAVTYCQRGWRGGGVLTARGWEEAELRNYGKAGQYPPGVIISVITFLERLRATKGKKLIEMSQLLEVSFFRDNN